MISFSFSCLSNSDNQISLMLNHERFLLEKTILLALLTSISRLFGVCLCVFLLLEFDFVNGICAAPLV